MHFKREVLIDFLDGALADDAAREVRDHLAECSECSDYVRSLERVFSLAGRDSVPEQPEAYWAGFGDGVRARLQSRQPLVQRIRAILRPTAVARPAAGARASRRRLALVVSPALAVAVALVFALMQAEGPERLADRLEPPLDRMTIDEIAGSMSDEEMFDDMLIEAADEEILAIEQYLLENEGVHQMIEDLGDDEIEELASTLAGLMKQKGTHMLLRDLVGKLS